MISLFTIAAMAAKNYYVNTENEIINKNEIKLLRKFDLLIQKTTSLEAQVQRLNLLSTTLANKTKVDIHSFQLNNEPALGGLDKSFYDDSEIVRESDLFKSIDVIDRRLSLLKARFSDIKNSIDRKGINNSHINNSKIEPDYSKSKSAFLSPVKQGYVSSSYGRRRDPINGHRRHHRVLI